MECISSLLDWKLRIIEGSLIMFGWFKKKKKQEVLPPLRAIHPHDLLKRKIDNGPERVVVIDHTQDMFTSPLYAYLPGNIWHPQYQAEIYSSSAYGAAVDNTLRSEERSYVPDQTLIQQPDPAPAYTAPDPALSSSDSGFSSDSSSSFSSDSGGGFSGD
jgi:hypothetical protein